MIGVLSIQPPSGNYDPIPKTLKAEPHQEAVSDFSYKVEEVGPSKADLGHFTEALALQAENTGLLARALAGQFENKKSFGETMKTLAPMIFTGAFMVVSFVRFDTSREKDVGAALHEMEARVKILEKQADDFQTTKTWWEKVRNNLAANGWLIDPLTGDIKRKGR